MKHTKVIGLTGGVGSGKSTIGRLMAQKFGVTLLVSDEVGHLCMEQGTETYKKIVTVFGYDILREDKTIDRKKLSAVVFGQEDRLEILNAIIHPAVRAYVETKIRETEEEQKPYFVLESAILLQSGFGDLCDEIWYVRISDETRRRRLKASRGYTDEIIDSILQNQWSDAQFLEKADRIIWNEGEESSILQQIETLLVMNKEKNLET